jgi:hypothetical protein
MHDTAVSTPEQQPPSLIRLTPTPQAWQNYTSCPWAISLLTRDHETENYVLCTIACKRWGCIYCARRKIRRMAFLTNGAKPNRMLTLTLNPDKWESPRQGWEATADAVPELIRQIRTTRGECEYLRVTELHKSGWPHYHLLLRSGFIPQKEVVAAWNALTGAKIVDIRKISDSFSSFRYLVKYLSKLHRLEWTDRHVSYSRNFYRPEDLEKIRYPERDVVEKIEQHPWKWLSDRYLWDEIGVDPAGNFHLPYLEKDPAWDHTPTQLGIAAEDIARPEPKVVQQSLAGMEHHACMGYEEDSF